MPPDENDQLREELSALRAENAQLKHERHAGQPRNAGRVPQQAALPPGVADPNSAEGLASAITRLINGQLKRDLTYDGARAALGAALDALDRAEAGGA